ncbi:MAG: DNA-3-methyladenine glycosylase [Bacteroidota bacterium]
MIDCNHQKLSVQFYQNPDVCEVAKCLLGKILVSNLEGIRTSGVIVETEAYSYTEKACHAYMNRNTNRTKVLFSAAGTAYVYLCYGIHKLLNVVTNAEGIAEAVLIRAVQPLDGIQIMTERRNQKKADYNLTSGPGKVCQALGIGMEHNTTSLLGNDLWIESSGTSNEEIVASPRIGVAYAKEDALLPWRFSFAQNRWVSKGNNSYQNVVRS